MPKPLIFGLIGHPVSQSLSPRLHQAAFSYARLSGEYQLFDIPPGELDQGLAALIASGIMGLNVTIPHKQAIYDLVQLLSWQAQRIGAVNAVKVLADGRLEGHNTDYQGLKLALEQIDQDDFSGQSALVLGAGGGALAACALIYDLRFSKLRILARDPLKQGTFIDFVRQRWLRSQSVDRADRSILIEPDQKDFWGEPALVINATSIGLTDEPPPAWMAELIARLPNDCLCFDMVYRKNHTPPIFARLAQERKLKNATGLDMLVHQARLSFEYWTGITVPFQKMKDAIS